MYQEVLKNGAGKADRVVIFDSITEFVRPKTENEKCMKIWNNEVIDTFHGGGAVEDPKKWFDAESQEEFMEILSKGHKRYVEMVQKAQVETQAPRKLRSRPIRSDFGDEVDIHAINCGNLSTAWRRRGPKLRVAAKNVRLIVHVSMLGGVSAKQAVWRGVAALSVAQALETAGYRLAIDVVGGADSVSYDHNGEKGENIVTLAPIKQYDEPLDIQSLSSVVCFPGFYRGPAFMNKGYVTGMVSSGLGASKSDSNMRKILKRYYTDPSEVIELVSKETLSKEAAQAEITRLMQSIVGNTNALQNETGGEQSEKDRLLAELREAMEIYGGALQPELMSKYMSLVGR